MCPMKSMCPMYLKHAKNTAKLKKICENSPNSLYLATNLHHFTKKHKFYKKSQTYQFYLQYQKQFVLFNQSDDEKKF
jgi:hypothetical protein